MKQPAKTGKQTLVEEGTELKGTVKSTVPVVVNGSLDGQIDAPDLTVTESGAVLGTVKAEKLKSSGTLAGDIDADEVFLSGTVRSKTVIRARSLEVKLTPQRGKLEVTFGECDLEVGEDPATKEDIAKSTAAAEEETKSAEEKPADMDPSWSSPPATGNDSNGASAEPEEAKPNGKKDKKKEKPSQAPPPA